MVVKSFARIQQAIGYTSSQSVPTVLEGDLATGEKVNNDPRLLAASPRRRVPRKSARSIDVREQRAHTALGCIGTAFSYWSLRL